MKSEARIRDAIAELMNDLDAYPEDKEKNWAQMARSSIWWLRWVLGEE